MKITYIYHSGFVIETDNTAIIIDFFKDTENYIAGYIHDHVLKLHKQIYVLASHVHPDHFNPLVLTWNTIRPDIRYIFSYDILETGKAGNDDAVFLHKFETYTDSLLKIKAYGSTDAGISFLIECEGKTIFHAGDLNNWHWKDESTPDEIQESEKAYLNELNDIYHDYKHINVVMFPVDPRQGTDYDLGARQFIQCIKTDFFIPMHFGENDKEVAGFRKHIDMKHTGFLLPLYKGMEFNL